ncbi:alcohol dehydrogenase catalytic domain-containing protein [Ahrensia marina]|uniref:zinc-dependent alcohol dehydrogenase n=1 Tax=Ahrensia marina TaxID=1514904 RepID=UPI0035CF81FC
MRALQVTGPKAIALREVPDPDVGPDDVLIAVKAVGICGTDIEIIDGHMAYYTSGAADYPITIGHEWVGTVEAMGSEVHGLSLGDQVVGEVSIGCGVCESCRSGAYHRCPYRTETGVMNRNGGMADKVALPSRAVHRVSDQVSLASAALVEPTAIAYNGVRLAGVSPSTKVAIIGDGPIGLLLLQVAVAFGAARLVMIGADTQRLALASKSGAEAVIDVRTAGWRAAVDEAFSGEAPDIILEASGNPAGVDAAIEIATPGATIVLQGLCGARPDQGFDLDRIVVNDLTLRGALGSPGIWPDVIDLIERGRIDPSLIVTHTLPLSDYAQAFEAVRSREAIKVILRPDA